MVYLFRQPVWTLQPREIFHVIILKKIQESIGFKVFKNILRSPCVEVHGRSYIRGGEVETIEEVGCSMADVTK